MGLQLPYLSVSRRTRATPWTEQVTAAGVQAYTVYNHMLLPTVFRGVVEDYEHLAEHVQVWDVACERQVQLKGPDAFDLLQLMTPRDMAKMKEEQCFYIPLVDANGKLMNDPVALKVGPDAYWVSVASSDAILFAKGLASGRGMNVEIQEPDINPLAIQGPKADELMTRVFGSAVTDIRFFRFKWLEFQGVPMVVARSGFSGRGGYEVYVPGPGYEGGAHPKLATDLWDTLFEQGQDLNVGPGCPNWIDFSEAGLLSFGNTIGYEHSPFEAGLGRYCDGLDTCLAAGPLKAEAAQGSTRKVRGVIFDEGQEFELRLHRDWSLTTEGGQGIGYVSAVAPSVSVGRPIGFATVDRGYWEADTAVVVHTPEGPRTAKIADLPFRK